MTSLVDKIVELHGALDLRSLPHAFGGALALAFHTHEPRGTRDINLNVFVPPSAASGALAALPAGVVRAPRDEQAAQEHGQVRLFWDDTPVDLFFSDHRFHHEAEAHVRRVPFAGIELPVLGATELAVFKCFCDRTKDWADVEAMLEAGSLDSHRALGWLVDLLGPDDHRTARLRDLVRPSR